VNKDAKEGYGRDGCEGARGWEEKGKGKEGAEGRERIGGSTRIFVQ